MLSFFLRDVLDEIWDLIESVFEVFPSYFCATLERTSGLEPFSEMIPPSFLSLLQIPAFALVLLTLSDCYWRCSSFVWSSQHLSPVYNLGRFCRIFFRASSSCSSSARVPMSSANRRLVIYLLPILTFSSCYSRASDIIRLRKMMKRVGDRRHPCLTPTVVLSHCPMLPFK